MKKNTGISLLIGVIVSVVALYFALKNVPASELAAYMITIEYSWVVLSIVVSILSFLIRAYRWQILLGSERQIGYWQAFHPLMIGFMVNCILPGRVGEVIRPIVLKQKSKVPFTTGIATVAAERAFDLLMLIGLFVVVMSTVRIDPNLDIQFGAYHLNKETLLSIFSGMVNLSILLVAGIVFIAFENNRKRINKCIMWGPNLFFWIRDGDKTRLKEKICVPLTKLVDSFATGFAKVKDLKALLVCTGLSMIIWGLSALSYYVMSLGCPGIGLTFYEITAMMVILCFFIALPSVPGYWGIWEAGGVFALLLFGVAKKDAAGYTLASHAIQTLPVVLVGLYSALHTGINIFKVSGGDK